MPARPFPFRIPTAPYYLQDERRIDRSPINGVVLLDGHDPQLRAVRVPHPQDPRHRSCVALPLIGLWLSCHLVALYGWTTGSYFPLFALYLFGELTSTIYVSVFFRWTKARSHAVKTIAANVFAILLLTTYAVLGMTGVTGQTSGQVGDTVGCMMTVGCLLPYAAPLVTVKIVLKTRSEASIPLGMCLAGAISNALWMVAGYLDNDMFMGFFQVTLYVIYRPGRYPSPTETPFENLNCVLPLTSSLTVTSDTTVESLPSPTFISVCSP